MTSASSSASSFDDTTAPDRGVDPGHEQRWLGVAGILGALAVGLGAFGAHALADRFAGHPDGATFAGWWETAASYHLAHALAVGLSARLPASTRAGRLAPVALTLGTLVFAGTLYAMALGAPRWLGAVTPLGGLSLIIGWALVAVAGLGAARRAPAAISSGRAAARAPVHQPSP